MSEMGMALMGTGVGHGETRAVEAARFAISSPLLEDLSIDGARGVLINITGGPDMTLYEVNEAATLVQEAAHEDANIIFGAVVDERVAEGEVRVTVIATGLDDGRMRRERDRHVGAPADEFANVRPLRREPSPASDPVPAAVERQPEPAAAAPAPPTRAAGPEEWPKSPEDWLSPFEDELDVPTFIRRGTPDKGKPEDRERPTFLRRSAD
jgi:cell division protein FtsZ